MEDFKRGQLVTIPETVFIGGKLVRRARAEQPKVMAISDNYAMLRFKGCMPFCESLSTLRKWNQP